MRACASELSLAYGISTPIRRICPDCCARKESGQATAEPPASVMKSRRLMERPLRTNGCTLSHCPAPEAMLCRSAIAICPLRVICRHSAGPRGYPPPKADISVLHSHVCFGPEAVILIDALHWITSSARAIRFDGIAKPSAFAVSRLITSSYLVGALYRQVAGLSPYAQCHRRKRAVLAMASANIAFNCDLVNSRGCLATGLRVDLTT
jgi:hypothetical protein